MVEASRSKIFRKERTEKHHPQNLKPTRALIISVNDSPWFDGIPWSVTIDTAIHLKLQLSVKCCF